MKRLIQMIKKLFSYKFIRFLFAGGINVLFSYLCFAILMLLIGNKELATGLNVLICATFNFLTSSKIVFTDSKSSVWVIVKFYGIYAVYYILNLLHLYVTVDLWGWNTYLAQLVSLFYLPIVSFTLQQLLVFRKPKSAPEESVENTEGSAGEELQSEENKE